MPTASMTASQFAARADAMVGLPYILGAEWPPSIVAPARPKALDCSELVEGLYREAGCPIGDLAAAQYDKTKPVTGSPRVGDLVFLRNNPARWNGIGHVAVITAKLSNGDFRIIEARGRAAGTVRTTLSYWKTRRYYTGVRRFPGFALDGQAVEVRTLKRGDAGADVVALQKQLNARGAKLTVDGDFGARTEAAVKAEQRAAKLTVDGQVGPKTRAALAAPKPEVPTVPTTPPAELSAVELLGIANCQSYNGQTSEASYRARARIMASKGWSVVAVCETTKQGRQWMCDELGKLTGHRWAFSDIAGKTVGVLWDDEVWSARSPRWRRFGNPPTAFGQGGMVQPLLHRLTRIGVDVGSIHVRPKDIASVAQKRGDVALATGLTKSWPIVWAGDFALDAPPMDGYMRVTAVTDTVKSDGGKNSRVDAAFIRGKIGAGKSRKIDPGPLSDHYWLDVELIIGGSTL